MSGSYLFSAESVFTTDWLQDFEQPSQLELELINIEIIVIIDAAIAAFIKKFFIFTPLIKILLTQYHSRKNQILYFFS